MALKACMYIFKLVWDSACPRLVSDTLCKAENHSVIVSYTHNVAHEYK